MTDTQTKPWILNAGEGWAEQYVPEPNTVIVSITEPLFPGNILKRQEPAKLKDGYVDVLRLEFQDFDVNRHKQIPADARLFDRQMAARLSRFLRKHRGKNIVVHCAAGISRSGGIVEAALEAFPEYEDRGWKRFPNTWVKILLKRALGLVPIGVEIEHEVWRTPMPDNAIKDALGNCIHGVPLVQPCRACRELPDDPADAKENNG